MGKLKLLPVLFVVVLSVCFGGSQILSGGDAESQLRLYRQRVGLMDSLIRQKCPGEFFCDAFSFIKLNNCDNVISLNFIIEIMS